MTTNKEESPTAHDELRNIANAKRFDRERFADDTEFADWAQNRARAILATHPTENARITPTDEQPAHVPATEYSFADMADAERWSGPHNSIVAAIAEALNVTIDDGCVVYVGENEPVEIDYDSLAEEIIERVEEQVYEQVGDVADTVGPFDTEQMKPLVDSIKQWVDQHADITCWRVEKIKAYGPGAPEYEAARALLQGASHAG
jgi:hypothetical protein